uniref:CUB domain containing protein 1 n=1 Tax=Leptobrachium leishanense TaxID=445787 RepID=A0A8C5M9Z1_9ANUR
MRNVNDGTMSGNRKEKCAGLNNKATDMQIPALLLTWFLIGLTDCNTGVCPFGNVNLQPSSLTGLNRTFSWRVDAPRSSGLELKFTQWLRQIHPLSKCRDRVTFTVGTLADTSSIMIGTFCRKGTISRIKVQGGAIVTLQAAWNETLTDSGFSIANRSSIKRLCIVESIFEKEATITLMSPNYLQGFPNKGLMTWHFIIPSNHRATVQFHNYTDPNCFMKTVRVEYDLPFSNNIPEVFQLDGRQPGNIAGNFNLSLENCELENLNPGALKLLFNVTVQKGTNIAKCTDPKICNVKNLPLDVPQTLLNLPVRLETVTWKLIPPAKGSTEIGSQRIKLIQSVPEKDCNTTRPGSFYHITSLTNENTLKFGTFCPNGSIEKMKMKGNVTIVLNMANQANRTQLNHDLYVSFVPPVKEESLFTLTPPSGSTVHLHTLNWDEGIPDYFYLSWSVDLSSKQTAQLKFDRAKLDIMCQMNSAHIYVKEKTAGGVDIVQKEDETLPSALDLKYPFWVNISNCKLKERMKFKLQFSITVKESNTDTTIIGIIAGSVLGIVIATIIVTVCCVKNRKKVKPHTLKPSKTKVSSDVSRRKGFKARKGNESHIYDVIDETMVYGHLLKHNDGPKNPEVDVYRPFEGPMDVYRPFEGPMDYVPGVPPQPVHNGSAKEDTGEDPLALSMRRNEIYDSSDNLPREPVEDEDTSLSYPIIKEREMESLS